MWVYLNDLAIVSNSLIVVSLFIIDIPTVKVAFTVMRVYSNRFGVISNSLSVISLVTVGIPSIIVTTNKRWL
ncbi:membrane protein [Candidatus Magnetobacterium bavaricum]|uniref:Membrane protein n=1 Tax=Candidatus Magnetobacterium bavaricum TaxID=29290 RepID=A0A0F3GPR3_9BACT|nr:membrane protein [Candidatus Magnetobacterium bavaricum]